jgi:predicted  nucleic acid-binding Zn-ribbon protein
VADEGLTRIGAMLEELGARFELVVEAVSGFGGKVDKLKEEIFGQFAEVGSQIRFLSDQIGENRSGLNSLRADFGAEMVRLNETIGRTRVEFREQLASSTANLHSEIFSQSEATRTAVHQEAASTETTADGRPASNDDLGRDVAESLKKLSAEIKQTNKAVATLSRKFERFDDRMTVQVKDQDQRLKKVETAGRRR